MKFLADENFNNDILRGVWRRIPDASFTRVQDTVIAGSEDARVLEYAIEGDYILLTHDVNTMGRFFDERVKAAQPAPGVFLIHKQTPVGRVVDEIELIILASDAAEWYGKITYVPFS